MVNNGGTRRRNSRRWLWIIAGIAGAGAVCAVVGIWHLPNRMYPGTSDGAVQARAALQGGLLTAAAALTAVAGALIALDETRQANTEIRRANTDVRRANENTHVRELYATAISQLGNSSIDVRLGGIYALARIARDSADDQQTVVDVLSAFARVHSTDPALRPDTPDPANPIRDAVDVHAAVTVLARLPALDGLSVLNDIPRADLTGADFTGPAHLRRIQAFGGNLTGTDLSGADLTHAYLTGTILSDANLDGANLTEVILFDANLDRANLFAATLTGAILRDATLVGADLTRADLTRANLLDANLDRANFDRANLDGANLTTAVGLVQGQVDSARGNGQTRLPVGLVRPASWGPEEPPSGS